MVAAQLNKHAENKSGVRNTAGGVFFQPKLTVNQPNDAYEQEADAMAEHVLRMPDTSFTSNSFFKPSALSMQRKCAHCEEEEKKMQRKEANSGEIEASASTENYINSLSGKGRSLTNEERKFFEPRMGYDFSNVRLHSNTDANESAKSVHALAYTHGNNIVFGSNQYQPDTDSGKKLMAHELTHVVQQNNSIAPKIQKVDDASFESLSGVDQGIANGTMAQTPIAGQTYTVTCGMRDYSVSFKFTKAMKGTYPYRAAHRDVKGIYVKIEASITDNNYCGRCTPMKLLQVLRNIKQGNTGNTETDTPTSATRETRAGWGNANAPSRGWMVDTTDASTAPFASDLSYTAREGSEVAPAIIWDSPGNWSNVTNTGIEFETCAVCQTVSGSKWIAACVNWGFYTDSSGNISFFPATPVASCRYTQQVRDASQRWDAIPGNTHTGITF
jgi:hypothetical protein